MDAQLLPDVSTLDLCHKDTAHPGKEIVFYMTFGPPFPPQ